MTEALSFPQFDDVFRQQFDDLLRWRRDMRHFRSDPLPDGMIEALLERAQWAPSVGNSQPWRFVRVRSNALRESIASHVDEEVTKAGERYTQKERAKLYASLKLHGLREAPEIIAVFSDQAPQAGHGLGAATMPETRDYSVVLAIEYLWLAARTRGVALGWVSILQPAFIATLLGTPDNWRFVALLCIGYPQKDAATPELARRGWQDRLDWKSNILER